MKPRSYEVTDGDAKAPARAMLRAVGMGDDDMVKPQIGVASSWNEITPCNLSLQRLAQRAKDGVRAAGGFPLEFGTISVSDGISMGHEGMRASLVSREVIADSVETVMFAERLDGSVLLAGCDKSLPGMLMAAARLDLASVFLYSGSTMPGQARRPRPHDHRRLRGRRCLRRGKITRDELTAIEKATCPGEGSCGGMYTANTMASVGRGPRHGLPGSAAPPAPDSRRDAFAVASGEAVVNMLRQGITARQIMTKKAFENAITVVMALGGSTNAVLHLMAIAHEAQVDLTLDDFNRIGDRTPHLADVKPFGRFVMTDIDRIGGVPVVMRALLDAGLLHGDALTVTGKTMAENLAEIAPPDPDGAIIHAMNDPIHKTGGLSILRGSLAPEGAVVKSAGFDAATFEGTARVFDGEQGAMDAVTEGTLKPGDVVVIRYEGPRGGPGMREMLAVTGAIKGAGPGQGRPAAHRRPVLRGDDGPVHRPRRTRGHRRRPDRLRPRRRPDPAGPRRPHARPGGRRGRARRAPGGLGAAAPALHHGGAGQVRQARRVGGPGRHLRLMRAVPGGPPRTGDGVGPAGLSRSVSMPRERCGLTSMVAARRRRAGRCRLRAGRRATLPCDPSATSRSPPSD